jgi:hypothetical protein
MVNNKARHVVYFEEESRRIIKISEFTPITNPADVDGVFWQLYAPETFSSDIETDMHQYQIDPVNRTLKKNNAQPTEEEKEFYNKLATTIDCLEILARHISVSRFAKMTNMSGYFFLVPEYQKEIENYRENGEIGPLLSSMVDNNDELPVVISEFEIKHQTAINFYILTETYWNKWSRMIRQSEDPTAVLTAFKNSIGMSKK